MKNRVGILGLLLFVPGSVVGMGSPRNQYKATVSSLDEFRQRLKDARLNLQELNEASYESARTHYFKKCWEAVLIDNFSTDNEMWLDLTKDDVEEYTFVFNGLYTFMFKQHSTGHENFKKILEDFNKVAQNALAQKTRDHDHPTKHRIPFVVSSDEASKLLLPLSKEYFFLQPHYILGTIGFLWCGYLIYTMYYRKKKLKPIKANEMVVTHAPQ